MKSLLINGVYTAAVGHAIEAFSVAAAFRKLNPEMRIQLMLHARVPRELCACVPDLRLEFLLVDPLRFESGDWPAIAPASLQEPWDYSFTLRDDSQVTWTDDGGLRRFHELFRENLRAGLATRMWSSPPALFPRAEASPLFLRLPAATREEARTIAPKPPGPRICLLTGSATEGKAPPLPFWEELITCLTSQFPSAEFVLMGKLAADYPTLNVTRTELLELARRHANVRLAFDPAILTQLALAGDSDLLVSPHSGMAFAIQCLGVPWLVLSGGPHYEYLLNGVPFRCVYPACASYPCHPAWRRFPPMREECRSIVHSHRGTLPCLDPAALRAQLPQIVRHARDLIGRTEGFTESFSAHVTHLRGLGIRGAVHFDRRRDGFRNWI